MNLLMHTEERAIATRYVQAGFNIAIFEFLRDNGVSREASAREAWDAVKDVAESAGFTRLEVRQTQSDLRAWRAEVVALRARYGDTSPRRTPAEIREWLRAAGFSEALINQHVPQ